ncbi:MAG: NAD(P)-dependent alcohol dehydrogenase [Chloroflexi bacterium]|nr:NAD(P)-dependent alcohol dehydrogenase [Chloroflexota bacterium]
MQAIVHQRFGAPDRALALREIEAPGLAAGAVRVRVRAAAVSKGDWLITTGLPYIARPAFGLLRPKQKVAGLELAGQVEAVGDAVTRFAPGDAVFGWGQGAFAEHASVPEGQLAAKPAGISYAQAAALPVSGCTALQALRDPGALAAGDAVLIIGASGGVGSFAVQIAKAMGAEVTGVASARNLPLLRRIGADHVIDYRTEAITDSGRRYDLILDIAGNRPLAELRRALAPEGRAVMVGGSGSRATMGFERTIRGLLLSPFVGRALRSLFAQPNLEDLQALAAWVESGALVPVVDRTFPLAEAATAVARVGAGHGHGKTVVAV